MELNSSISEETVVFKRVLGKHESKTSKRVHYKVLAVLNTEAGAQRCAYWFSADRLFLRQRDQATGKPSLKIGCSAGQRAQIQKLVKRFNAAD